MKKNSDLENAYALIIGISKYRDPRIPELRFTRADAEGMYKLLTDPKKVGLNPDNIKLLLDDDATAFNIKNAISSWLFKNADPNSVVFIYFAGHGGVEEDRLGIEKDKLAKYLLPFDTSFDDLYSSAISNRDFNELLLTIRSTRLVIFMDSCYSGGVSERKARDLKITDDPYQKIGEGEGRIVIAASKPDQRSFEDSRLGHGIFTYNLIEALSGKADLYKVGYVTVLDAYKYLENNVPDLARKLAGGEQDPVLRGDITKDFAISVNRERLGEIEKEKDREIKLKKLREFYRAGKFSGQLYEKLRMVAETDTDRLQEKEIDIAKIINDLLSTHISLETFLENLKDIVPELFDKQPEYFETKKIPGIEEEESRKQKEKEEYQKKEIENKAKRKEELKIKEKEEVQLEIEPAPKERKKIPVISSIPVIARIFFVLIALIAIFMIAMSQKPILAVSPDPVSINIGEIIAGENVSRTYLISNSGKGTLNWKIGTDKKWVTITPDNGTDSGTVNILVNTAGLEPGSLSGIITIKSNGGEKSGTISVKILKPPAPLPEINNSIGMIFVQIPPGEFEMGSGSNEKGRLPWEGPLHNVEIAKSFYIGEFEVTNKQWFDIMGYSTSISPYNGDNLPLVQVTWDDALKFIKNLNEKERTTKYRLPSEAEWEYAARAGTTSMYSFGDNESMLVDYAWYGLNAEGITHPIGQKKPNPWELYDIHGNVWEWVQDKLHDNYDEAPTNGSAWISGITPYRVVRGGSLNSLADNLRSASRTYEKQNEHSFDIGFRLVKDL
jgi:formylglycine-generating enzyme required for sulfatase activity